MKILVIACYSPLINNSAAIESLMYLNFLCTLGHEVHLLTVDFPKDSIYYDENMLELLNKEVKLHLVKGGFIFNKALPRKMKNDLKENNKKSIKINIKKIKNKLLIPDAYLGWTKRALKYYNEHLEKVDFHRILSMHEPPSSHILGLKIQKMSKARWIAYWSDPWVRDRSREGAGYFRKKIESHLEKKVVLKAHKHIFVTRENKDDFKKLYNIEDENLYILTRTYDRELYKKIKNEDIPNNIKNDKINLIYTGEIFSELRDIRPFLEVINSLAENIKEKLNILIIGNIDNEEIKDKARSMKVIKVLPRVNYKEALKYIVNADILLLWGNKNSKQIPAKIYDYLGGQGPILTILGDRDDPLKKLSENIDKCFNAENNVLDIEKQLYNIMSEVAKGNDFKEKSNLSYEKALYDLKKIIES